MLLVVTHREERFCPDINTNQVEYQGSGGWWGEWEYILDFNLTY